MWTLYGKDDTPLCTFELTEREGGEPIAGGHRAPERFLFQCDASRSLQDEGVYLIRNDEDGEELLVQIMNRSAAQYVTAYRVDPIEGNAARSS